jgi:hypothetical protein
MTRIRLPFILTLSLATLSLGAAGCANGHSPTEPSFSDLDAPAKAAVSSISDESGGGGGDGQGDDNNNNRRGRGRGGDNRGRGRGGDDQGADDRNRRGRGGNNRPDDRPQPPRAGQEFEAAVVAVDGQTLTLAGGTRVTVNGQTQWSARGDLFSLSQVAGSVAAGKPTRVEGRGARQADGSILAQTIKAEVD